MKAPCIAPIEPPNRPSEVNLQLRPPPQAPQEDGGQTKSGRKPA
jgi:hypothetical protein